MKPVYVAVILFVIAAGGYVQWQRSQSDVSEAHDQQDAALVDIILPPTLSAEAELGKRGFEAKCAACHGLNAVGRDNVEPPLVHVIYEPNHHGDGAFFVAAANGVRQHHWPFGNMPPVEGVTTADVKTIVKYVRELQVANGIN